MNFTLEDILGLRTPEECATYIDSAKGRIKDLDAEWAGKSFDGDARAEFLDLQKVVKAADAKKVELEHRREVVAALVGNPTQVEATFAMPATPSLPSTFRQVPATTHRSRRVPENIFALDEYHALNNSQTELMQAYRDGAMFAVERAAYPGWITTKRGSHAIDAAAEQSHLAWLLNDADKPSKHNPNRELAQRILHTGTDDYLSGFTKAFVDGNTSRLTPSEMRAVGSWTVQTDATGGFAVPFYFDPTLLHTGAWTWVNPYRALCNVKTIVGTDTFNGASTTSFTVSRAAEHTASTEGLGAVAQITAIVAKVQGAGKYSIELLQDRPDITSEIASIIAEAKDTEEENVFSVGIGDAVGAGFNPIGALATASTSGAYTRTDTAAQTTLAVGDAALVEAALPLRHRRNAVWFMSKAALRQYQALESVRGELFGGQYYGSTPAANRNANGDTGVSLINYPVYEAPSGASGLAANAAVSVLFNPDTYYIIERAGMSVETIPHFFDAATGYPTGERVIYAYWRNTAKPATVDGGRRQTIHA